jgi:hypothetical protein
MEERQGYFFIVFQPDWKTTQKVFLAWKYQSAGLENNPKSVFGMEISIGWIGKRHKSDFCMEISNSRMPAHFDSTSRLLAPKISCLLFTLVTQL